MLYCAKFYGRGFIRVYEDKTPVIKLCTVQHYPIIKPNSPHLITLMEIDHVPLY